MSTSELLSKRKKCRWCDGSGIVAGPGEYTHEKCSACRGTGAPLPPVKSPVQEKLEKCEAIIAEQQKELATVKNERNLAAIDAGNKWIWSDTDPNSLESMGENMVVSITAGQLRKLLSAREPAELKKEVFQVLKDAFILVDKYNGESSETDHPFCMLAEYIEKHTQ